MKLQFLTKIMLLLCFLLPPFLFWGGLRAEVYRVWLTLLLIDTTLFLWILSWFFNRSKKKLSSSLASPQQKIIVLGLGLIVIILGSVGLNQSFSSSLAGNFYRGDGLALLFHGVALVYLVSQQTINWTTQKLIFTQALAALLFSFLLVIQWVVSSATGLQNEVMGANGLAASLLNSSYAAGFLVISFPSVLATVEKVPYFYWLAKNWLVFLITVAVILTQSWVAMGLALGLLVSWRYRRRLQPASVIAVAIVAILGFWLGVWYLGDQYSSVDNRAQLYFQAYQAVVQKPWLGWGWAQFAEQASILPIYADQAHATLFEVAVSAGLVGATAYVVAIGLILQFFQQKIQQATSTSQADYWWLWLLVVVSFVVFSQTNLVSVVTQLLFWSAVGVVFIERDLRK